MNCSKAAVRRTLALVCALSVAWLGAAAQAEVPEALGALEAFETPGALETPNAPEAMSHAVAETALAPDLVAPSAWAVVTPDGGGFATETGAVGASADTRFLIGSLSKPLAAAATMVLVDAGLASLDEPVATYLSEFRAGDPDPITLREVLSHTSGLPREAEPAAGSLLERALTANELPRGDATFAYANLNYAIVGAVIEAISGESYAAFVERSLFAPLGMFESSAEPGLATVVARNGHRFAFGVPFSHVEHTPPGAEADGFTVSTANDLAAFGRMLLRGGTADDGTRVLSTAAVALLLTEATPTSAGAVAPGTSGYGLGWGTGGDPAHPIAAHSGRTDGFFAELFIRPADGEAIVFLQSANGPLYDQSAPVRVGLAALGGKPASVAGQESAATTALIFATTGVGLLIAVGLVSTFRLWRDRKHPPTSRASAQHRLRWRVLLDVSGAVLLLVACQLFSSMMLTGAPSLFANPLPLSTELPISCGAVAAALLLRCLFTLARARRSDSWRTT